MITYETNTSSTDPGKDELCEGPSRQSARPCHRRATKGKISVIDICRAGEWIEPDMGDKAAAGCRNWRKGYVDSELITKVRAWTILHETYIVGYVSLEL